MTRWLDKRGFRKENGKRKVAVITRWPQAWPHCTREPTLNKQYLSNESMNYSCIFFPGIVAGSLQGAGSY